MLIHAPFSEFALYVIMLFLLLGCDFRSLMGSETILLLRFLICVGK